MFGMKSVRYVMLLLLLLFQGSFSMFSLKQHVKHVISRLSTAMKTGGSTAMSDMGLKECWGHYTIIVSLARDKKTTIIKSSLKKLIKGQPTKQVEDTELRMCEVIHGDLTIRAKVLRDHQYSEAFDNITLNDILGNIQKVTGYVKICDTPDLSAIVRSLSNLETIRKMLFIIGNSDLGSMKEGFTNLSKIGEKLVISSNECSFTGWFPELLTVGDHVTISDNDGLVSLYNVCPRLSKIGSFLEISSNRRLHNLDAAFPSLSKIGSFLHMNFNFHPVTLKNAFLDLSEIKDDLLIEHSPYSNKMNEASFRSLNPAKRNLILKALGVEVKEVEEFDDHPVA